MVEKAGVEGRFDSLEQELYLNLWRTYDRLRALEDEFFRPYGLTAQQYNVLRLLRAEHPESVPTLALAQRLVSRAPDITRMVDRLEEKGLVARERQAENRRVVRIAITPAGNDLLDEMADPLRQCHERQVGHLKEGEMRQLIALLRQTRAPHEGTGSSWR